MTFQAYCPHCDKTVTAMTVLGDDELKRALDSNGHVEVMHTTHQHGDHRWNLVKQEKANLRKQMAEHG